MFESFFHVVTRIFSSAIVGRCYGILRQFAPLRRRADVTKRFEAGRRCL